MRLLEWTLISSGCCPVRRGNLDTHTEKWQHADTKTKCCLQTKERGLRRNQSCPHLKLVLVASRNARKYIFVVWAIPRMVLCYAAQENWYTKTQMYRVAREGGEEEKICVVVPSTEHPHSATCDWTPSMSQVLSQLPRIQQWANWHIFCPSSTDSLSVSSPRGLVKDASQHSLDPSPLGVTYSPHPHPHHLYLDGNKDVRSFSTAHLRRGNIVSFCSWRRGAVKDRKKRKLEMRGAEHPSNELHLITI